MNILKDKNSIKRFILFFFCIIVLILGFILDHDDVLNKLKIIYMSDGVLFTDYTHLTTTGVAMINVAIVGLFCTILMIVTRKDVTGLTIGAFFTNVGFSFFGKNLFNIFPFFIGGYLYSLFSKKRHYELIDSIMLSTGVSPLVSFIALNKMFHPALAVSLGIAVGIFIGFIFMPLLSMGASFHRGYNIYNSGFVLGVIAMVFIRIFTMFDVPVEAVGYPVTDNYENSMVLFVFFIVVFFTGFALNKFSFRGYGELLKNTGRNPSDFLKLYGAPVTMMNMSIIGTMALVYSIASGGEISGPVIGCILTIFGFGAFGKHLRNIAPIFLGILIAQFLNIHDTHSTSSMVSALLGTTLAPIAGEFGILWGTLAGIVHVGVVSHVVYLHAGFNLYNNGFAGGFVAAIFVPIIEDLRKIRKNNKLNIRKRKSRE